MRELMEEILGEARRRGADFADLRVIESEGTSVSVGQPGRPHLPTRGRALYREWPGALRPPTY